MAVVLKPSLHFSSCLLQLQFTFQELLEDGKRGLYSADANYDAKIAAAAEVNDQWDWEYRVSQFLGEQQEEQ